MQSVSFITSTSQDRIKLISPTPITHTYLEQFLLLALMTTYLKDLAQSLGRYDGLLKIIFGFKGFLDAQVVSLLGAKNLASMRGKGKLNMLDNP